jgi:hypothetical protein
MSKVDCQNVKNHFSGCHNPSNFLNFDDVTKILSIKCFDDVEFDAETPWPLSKKSATVPKHFNHHNVS